MPSTPASCPGSNDSGQGLRALAALVAAALNEIRTGLGTGGLTLAMAGPTADVPAWRNPAAMAIDLGPAPATSGIAKSSALQAAPTDDDPKNSEPEFLDEQHSETWALVRLAQAGDGEAFGQLYDRYVDTVFRFVYFRVNDRALAEDFTSETFLRALRRISTISYQGRDIGAWFITIARNIILDHMKSARHRLEITTSDSPESNDREPSTEDAVLETLASEHLLTAVKQLGDEQRECVMLRFVHGLSVSETANVMGKNDGAIKALQHRAVRKLADLIGTDLQ